MRRHSSLPAWTKTVRQLLALVAERIARSLAERRR
jgi:hypothetical protein